MSESRIVKCDGCGKSEEKTPLYDDTFADKWIVVYVHTLIHDLSLNGEKAKHFCGDCWKAGEAAILARVVTP